MKRIERIFSNVAVIVTMVMLSATLWVGLTQYTNYAVVTSVEDDIINITDMNGEGWSFYGNGYTEGQLLSVRFDHNHTRSYKYDDIIIDAKVIQDNR